MNSVLQYTYSFLRYLACCFCYFTLYEGVKTLQMLCRVLSCVLTLHFLKLVKSCAVNNVFNNFSFFFSFFNCLQAAYSVPQSICNEKLVTKYFIKIVISLYLDHKQLAADSSGTAGFGLDLCFWLQIGYISLLETAFLLYLSKETSWQHPGYLR